MYNESERKREQRKGVAVEGKALTACSRSTTSQESNESSGEGVRGWKGKALDGMLQDYDESEKK